MKQATRTLLCVLLLTWAASAGAGEAERTTRPLFPREAEVTRIRKITEWLNVVLTAGCLSLGSVGMMLVAAARSPWRVRRAEQALRRGSGQMVFLGVLSELVLVLLAFLYAALGKKIPPLGVMALIAGGVFMYLAALGLAASARILGERLLGDDAAEQSSWRVIGAGGLAIGAAGLVPIFGWAYFLFVLCRGIGAATIALFANRPRLGAVAVAPPAGLQPAAEPEPDDGQGEPTS